MYLSQLVTICHNHAKTMWVWFAKFANQASATLWLHSRRMAGCSNLPLWLQMSSSISTTTMMPMVHRVGPSLCVWCKSYIVDGVKR
jgi:hypothetical protein